MIDEIARHRVELQALCRRNRVRRLELFGSAARDDFDPGRSDVDFLVEFDRDSLEALTLRAYFDFKEQLEALLGRSVDLVDPAIFAIHISRRASSGRGSQCLKRDAQSLVWDAREAEAIAAMAAGKSFFDFNRDIVLRSAIERQFEIIGEALARVARLDAAKARQIPSLREAMGLRNILIHGYATIDRARVWRTVKDDLPDLRAALDALLAAPD